MSDASVSTTEDRRTVRQSMTRSTIENKKDYVSKTTMSLKCGCGHPIPECFVSYTQIKVEIKEKVLSVE